MDVPKERKKNKTIDGGWAWVVAAGMSIIFMIIGGFHRGFGIFYSALVDEFESSASMTSMIQGFRFAALCISAPIACSLSERFTERMVLLIGSGVFSLALILTYFTPNLEFTVLTLGALTGLGMALLMTSAQIAIGKYFEKYRSLANSITFCGSSAGMMAMPNLIIYFMKEYGLRGSFLLYGAIFLNCAACGAVVRPLTINDMPQEQTIDVGTKEHGVTEKSDNPKLLEMKEGVLTEKSNPKTIFQDDIDNIWQTSSEKDPILQRKRKDEFPRSSTKRSLRLNEKEFESSPTDTDSYLTDTPRTSRRSSSTFSTSHLQSLRQTSLDGSILLPITQDLAHEETTEEDLACPPEPETPESRCETVSRYLKSILDFSLFRNARYMVFLLATSCAMVGFSNVTVFLIPHAEEYGIPRDKAALLLSIAGGCDIIGRLILGALADVKKLGPHRVMIVGLILIGIATCLLPLAKTFTTMVVYSVVFGLIGSSGHLLSLPIVILFVGRSRMPRAMGLVMSFHAISSAVSHPILGYIKDLTGTYDSTFYICGAFQIFSSSLMMLGPIVRKYDLSINQKVVQLSERESCDPH